MSKIIPTEEQEQIKFIEWCRLKKIFVFAIANENKHSFMDRNKSIIIQKKNTKMGALKGASDLIVMLDNAILFIELKRAVKSKSRVSDEQIAFIEKVSQYPYAKGKVCYGFDDAVSFVIEHKE